MEDEERKQDTQDAEAGGQNNSAGERLDGILRELGSWLEKIAESLVSVIPTLLSPEVLSALLSRFLSSKNSKLSSGLLDSSKIVMRFVAMPAILSRLSLALKRFAIVFFAIMVMVTMYRFIPVFHGFCQDLSWKSDLMSEEVVVRRNASLHFLEITSGDDVRALDSLRSMAICGDAESCLHLANYYSLREFEPKGYSQRLDEERAAYWYLQGAQKGNAQCQARIGECYMLGAGVRKDQEKACSWITKSAELNNPLGLKLMGDCHYMGYGTEKNLEFAVKFWTDSRALGNSDAAESLERIFE